MQMWFEPIPVKVSGFGEPQEVHLDVNLKSIGQSCQFSAF